MSTHTHTHTLNVHTHTYTHTHTHTHTKSKFTKFVMDFAPIFVMNSKDLISVSSFSKKFFIGENLVR